MNETEARETSERRRRLRSAPVRYAFEEMKFLRSFKDLRNFYEKVRIVFPRVTRTFDRFHMAPPVLQIEPTNYCNANCICCPTARSSRKRGYMDSDLFCKIIDDASMIGVRAVFLFLHGEPMLHPGIVEMIRYIKLKGLAYHMTTNGVPFDEKKIRGILGSGTNNADHISFSILGASKEVHEKIVRPVSHEKVVENLHMLLNMRKSMRVNGPVIEVIFHTMPENRHEEDEFIRKWRGVLDHVRMSGDISQSFSEYKRERPFPVVRTRKCLNLWQKMTILWNGDVTLCCEDVDGDWIFGNLNEQTISEVWNDKKLLAIKSIHKKRQFDKIPFCYSCDM